MQLAWAQNVPGRVLMLSPLCVAEQTVGEGQKLGIEVVYAKAQPDAAGARIVITNYERLDGFHADQFAGVVLDESSILKAFDGKTRKKLIETFAKTPYRLCCTATPSPNDIAELANHAEFLGLMTRAEFLATWFVHDDAGWCMKGHARQPFYRWLASWAVALRTPSDIGYSDDGFVLPPLTIEDHVVEGGDNGGVLFPELGLKGLTGRIAARRASVEDRVAKVAELVNASDDSWICWCGLNDESDQLARVIPGSVAISGNDSYQHKQDAIMWFTGQKCFCDEDLSGKLSVWHSVRQKKNTSEPTIANIESSATLNQSPISENTGNDAASISATTCGNTCGGQTSFERSSSDEPRSLSDGESNTPQTQPCESNIGNMLAIGRGATSTEGSTKSSNHTVSRETNTSASSQLNQTPAPFAEEDLAISLEKDKGSISIIATKPNMSEDSSARNATRESVSSTNRSSGSDVQLCICGRPLGKRVLITKFKIMGWGMNFQQCHKMAFVGVGDSYEAYYQALRRCWRFGQKHPVDAHIVVSDIERAVVSNVRRKQANADEMSRQIIAHMSGFEREELASSSSRS